MENTLPVSNWIALELLRQLKNELFIGSGFNSDFADEFTREFPIGETVNVKQPWRPIGGEGIDYDPEPIDIRTTPVTVDRVPHVHFEWNSIEQALKLSRGREKIKAEILAPSAQRMRQQFEIIAAQHAAINAPNVFGTLGTDPTTLGFAAQARARLIEMGGWTTRGRRTCAVTPGVMTAITQAATVTTPLFNPGDEISAAFKEGYLGRNGGWDMQESMSVQRITAGTRAGACTVSGAVASGSSSITLACTAGDTFVAGEKFSIGADATGPWPVNPGTRQQANTKAFTVSIAGLWGQTYTATGATISLPITDVIEGPASGYVNITTLPAGGETVTFWPGTTAPNGKSGSLNVLFNRDAFAIVGVKMANPEQGGTVQIAAQERDPETGISVAVLRIFDGVQRRWINRFDALLGVGNFYNRNCAAVFASA
jgi:hypothetical protein